MKIEALFLYHKKVSTINRLICGDMSFQTGAQDIADASRTPKGPVSFVFFFICFSGSLQLPRVKTVPFGRQGSMSLLPEPESEKVEAPPAGPQVRDDPHRRTMNEGFYREKVKQW